MYASILTYPILLYSILLYLISSYLTFSHLNTLHGIVLYLKNQDGTLDKPT